MANMNLSSRCLKLFLTLLISLAIYSEGILSNLRLMPVQSFPLIIPISLVSLLIFFPYYRLSTIGKYIFLFVIYLQIITMFNLFLSDFSFIEHYLRAFLSLISGYILFIFFSFLFKHYTEENIKNTVLIGFWVVSAFSIIEFLITSDRVKGYIFFSEPSHLGYYISLLVIPYVFLNRHILTKFKYIIILLLAFSNLFLTFSTTAFIALLLVMIIFFMFSRTNITTIFKLFLSSLIIFYLLFLFLWKYYPNNYARLLIEATINALLYNPEELPYSFSDRMQFFYILSHILSNISRLEDLFLFLFGHGLGSERFYFNRIYPEYLHYIPDIKAGSLLTSFQSKVFVYGGISLFVTEFVLLWILIKRIKLINNKLAGVLTGVFLSSFFLLGALGFPIIWFWLAYTEKKLRESDRLKYF